ncbi:hypothetical protein RI054_19g87050 [Pseudoscourfieldia marina]
MPPVASALPPPVVALSLRSLVLKHAFTALHAHALPVRSMNAHGAHLRAFRTSAAGMMGGCGWLGGGLWDPLVANAAQRGTLWNAVGHPIPAEATHGVARSCGQSRTMASEAAAAAPHAGEAIDVSMLPPLLRDAPKMDVLVAQVRTDSLSGTNVCKKIRRLGRVPGVLSVPGSQDILLTFDFHQLTNLLVKRNGRVGLYGRMIRIFIEHEDAAAYTVARVPDPSSPRPTELGWWDSKVIADVAEMKARFNEASSRCYGAHAETMVDLYGARNPASEGGAGVIVAPRLVHASLGHGKVENVCFRLVEPRRNITLDLPVSVRGGEAAAGIQSGQFLHKLRWNLPASTSDPFQYPPPDEGIVVNGGDMKAKNDAGKNANVCLGDVSAHYLPDAWRLAKGLGSKRYASQPVVRVAGRRR